MSETAPWEDYAPPVTAGGNDAEPWKDYEPQAEPQKNPSADLVSSATAGPKIGDSIGDTAHEIGSSLYHSVVGGYKGLGTLLTTRDPDKAADTVNDELSQSYQAPDSAVKTAMHSGYNPLNWVQGAADYAADKSADWGASPGVSTAIKSAPTALGLLGAGTGLLKGREGPNIAAEDAVSQSAAAQSMGAAAAGPDLSAASPELKQAISDTAKRTGGKINTDVLQNRLEAEKHGVDLMKGQVTRDPIQFSAEQNSTDPKIVSRINAQNAQMTDAIDSIRRDVSPAYAGNDPIENGQTAVDSLKAYDQPIQADIKSKYKALVDANQGDLPIDPVKFVSNVDAALKKQYLTDSVPKSAASLLNSLRAGEPLDFEGFEAARSRLAEAQRGPDASEAAAAKVIRGQLEQFPMQTAPASLTDLYQNTRFTQLKELADTARAAAKARFDALDSDPAYQAAVDDVSNGVKIGQPSPLADKFLDRYAIGAPKANLDLMMGKLDSNGREAVQSHALSKIRQAAVGANGNVLPNGYNTAIRNMRPKFSSLFTPETQENLDSLGRVITNAKVAPPGHYVNYSKSGVLLNAAQGLGESAINAKTFGLGMPIIKTLVKDKFAKDALDPAAGLDYPFDKDRPTRATGGKVGPSDDELVERLMARWKKAKRVSDKATEPLLKLPDSTVAVALKIANKGL